MCDLLTDLQQLCGQTQRPAGGRDVISHRDSVMTEGRVQEGNPLHVGGT